MGCCCCGHSSADDDEHGFESENEQEYDGHGAPPADPEQRLVNADGKTTGPLPGLSSPKAMLSEKFGAPFTADGSVYGPWTQNQINQHQVIGTSGHQEQIEGPYGNRYQTYGEQHAAPKEGDLPVGYTAAIPAPSTRSMPAYDPHNAYQPSGMYTGPQKWDSNLNSAGLHPGVGGVLPHQW